MSADDAASPTTGLPELSARRIVELVRSGGLDPAAYARALCERNRALNPALSVWAWFDEAAFLEEMASGGALAGPLAGLPVAVKDIFDTADMPTEYGSPLLKGRRPLRDAAGVAAIRAAGGVVMGKTVTTEFANASPGPTRNPHDAAHTPGGSSSGSAAAVAAGLAPVAIGSQTAGSVIRPAAYCGVVGFKPSFGRINRAGMLSFSESLDTAGAFGRTIDDVWLLAEAMAGAGDPARIEASEAPPPRIGVCETPEWGQAAPETLRAIEAAAEALRRAGATVRDMSCPAVLDGLSDVQKGVMAYEASRAFAHESRAHPEGLSPQLSALLAEGRAISTDAYGAMVAQARGARKAWAATFDAVDVVLTASAIGEAPRGIENTGDPVFNRIWSLLHGPCLHVPTGKGPGGLPIGVQLVGPVWSDQTFMRHAAWMAAEILDL